MSRDIVSKSPVPYAPSVEQVDPDEHEVIAEIERTMAKIREKTFEDSGHARRSGHAKGHGVLRAKLTVLPGLP